MPTPIPATLREQYRRRVTLISAQSGSPPGLDWSLWPGNSQKKWTTRYLQEKTREAGLKAIGRIVTPHMLRHTYATALLKGSNTRVVQIALGHVSLRSTQIYTHPSSDEIEEATSKLWGNVIEEEESE